LGEADPARKLLAGVLLDDPLALDPVGIALEVQRPAREVREHRVRDLAVVVGEVGLGDARGEHDLPRPGNLDRSASGADLAAHDGRSRTTSRAGLSVRRPW